MQYALDTLGYSVGETGFDGKYGPRTTRAVRAFKKDYNVPGPANQFGLRSLETIEAIATGRIPIVQTPSSTGNQPTQTSGTGRRADGDPNFQAPGFPSDMTRGEIERIIREEAELRGIDPDVAVAIFRAEGASAYQSTVRRRGRGSLGGREASFGPYQLYIGGGLGNVYQDRTGRDLTQDNTREGIINQIRFALDMAISQSWQPWYGRGPAGVGRFEGLRGGTTGVVLNKPSTTSVQQLCYDHKITYPSSLPMVHVGGPINPAAMVLLHTDDWNSQNTAFAGNNLLISSDKLMMLKLSQGNEPIYWRMIVGLSAWAPGQLDMEIKGQFPYSKEHRWLTADPNEDIMFGYDGEEQWNKALEMYSHQTINQWF